MSETPLIAEFKQGDGTPVSVNLANVDIFRPSVDGTVIVLSDGVEVKVSESYDAVSEMLNPERQAGS